jgi:hypothetical protein
MNLEAKKWNVVQMIASIDNEAIIDEISAKIIQLIPEEKEPTESTLLSKYAVQIEEKIDLEKLKKEQNFEGVDAQKMDRLAKEADIEESIDELFEMLD